ncbi:MAG TPA: sigma-70 family RNA polymerase sigma factor [Acetobacteraceae bacterium]|nr:sigma-70 family RNA polymerase sigma factor [Acetobacteraceae bacterium]
MIVSRSKDDYARLVLPHLAAAYRLALWLLRDPATAEDVVQDAAERALRFIGGFRGGNERAWLLRIVRNAAMDHLGRTRPAAELDDETEDPGLSPESALLCAERAANLHEAVAALPPKLRECLVLRELEELSYRDIADIAGIPIGTVMSRLAAARQKLMAQTRDLRP